MLSLFTLPLAAYYVSRYGRLGFCGQTKRPFVRMHSPIDNWRGIRNMEMLLLLMSVVCATNNLAELRFARSLLAPISLLHAIKFIGSLVTAAYFAAAFLLEPIPSGCDKWFQRVKSRHVTCDDVACLTCRPIRAQGADSARYVLLGKSDFAMCRICFERSANRILTECDHMICGRCLQAAGQCPFCGVHIKLVQRLNIVPGEIFSHTGIN
uniref:RING-type domain-containing protein n=1 Tax=Plectus sambesii TaxID=2011161 RepID=A0A914UK74_9BILA